MNIDWNCKSAEGCDWALLSAEIGMLHFYNYRPSNNSISWNCKGVSGEPSYKHYTLHERPKAEQMKEKIYTKEMHEAGKECEVGMKFQSNSGYIYTKLLPVDARGLIAVSHNGEYLLFALSSGINPIDARTDKEKAIDNINFILINEVAAKSTRQIAEHIVNKIEYLTFTGDK